MPSPSTCGSRADSIWLGHCLSLRALPSRWNIDDTGSILLEAYIEEVHVGTGLPLADSGAMTDHSGRWSLIVPTRR